jgi:nicotinate phosphoribosyltransferase
MTYVPPVNCGPSALYRPSLALLTDLYQLTMAYGYWKLGRHEDEAVFHLTFRRAPFGGAFAVAAGLEPIVDMIENLRFDDDDLAYLATLVGNDDEPLFEQAFLDWLAGWELRIDIDAVPEGTVVFPRAPLLRVRGPLLQCQVLETALLNTINFQTLIATKASRIRLAARGEPILEFGLRRAQGVDGSLAASRAAYIGGCSATSNVLAGRLYGIPVQGTHAHSWVMAFADEPTAFAAYAEALPNNCVFLVDTYDTLEGVRNAVKEGLKLREQGRTMVGIRLDSGDLAALSIAARRILDEAGFEDAAIVASNDLDEYRINALKEAGAKISVWGVGTRLVTAYDQPALGGVYKLAAIRAPGEAWRHTVKLSEQPIKVSDPGILGVRRYKRDDGCFFMDLVHPVDAPPGLDACGIDPFDAKVTLRPGGLSSEDLLVPILRGGRRVWTPPPLVEVRARTAEQLACVDSGRRLFDVPVPYPVLLEETVHAERRRLIEAVSVGVA